MVHLEKLKSVAFKAGPSGRDFEKLNGERHFIQADTAWELLHRLTREEVIEYLDVRQQQGFNGVLTVVIPELDGKATPEEVIPEDVGSEVFYPNRYGQVPFIKDDPTKPNEKYFEHIDWCVEQMIQRGITPFLVPTWGRYINTAWSWGPILFNESNARSFGAYLGQRYPFLPKLLGGDTEPLWINSGGELKKRAPKWPIGTAIPEDTSNLPSWSDLELTDSRAVIVSFAAGILETEDPMWSSIERGRPILSYHPMAYWLPNTPIATASAVCPGAQWLTLDGCQSGHTDGTRHFFKETMGKWNGRASHEPLGHMWKAEPAKPIIDLESHYEAAPNGLVPWSEWMWDEHDIRTGAWQSLCAGTAGIVYGVNAIWQMYDEEIAKLHSHHVPFCAHKTGSWKSFLQLPGAKNLHLIRDYFLSLPDSVWNTRRPAQELLVSSNAPANVQNTDGRIDLMRDVVDCDCRGSSWVLAHSGMGYGFTLDLSVVFACRPSVSMEWLDPRTGKVVHQGQIVPDKQVTFTPPSGGSVKEDWVLILKL